MTPRKQPAHAKTIRPREAGPAATAPRGEPFFDLEHHQFFLASVNLEDEVGDIHFLVSEEEGRSGLKISEIVLKCLLPSRHPSRWAATERSRATLRAIHPVDFVEARSAQIPCLGVKGIRFWRLRE